MLKQLYIRDFALIDELDIDIDGGFSVITGETGAGKSILLGAIALLTGGRADTKAIKQGASKCVVEAVIDISRYDLGTFFEQNGIEADEGDCIVRREVAASGKSRAFINDTPVGLGVMKELGDRLIDIHSQHKNLLIGRQDFQLGVVDIMADDKEELDLYRQAYSLHKDKEQQLRCLREEAEASKAGADFMEFQWSELEGAHLVDGEQEELEAKATRMSHAEEIKAALFSADRALSAEETGMTGSLARSIGALKAVEGVMPQAGEMAGRMESVAIELKDIARDVARELERVDFDPADLDAVTGRLDLLYGLQRKYRCDGVGALIALRDELKQKLAGIESSDERLGQLEKEVGEALEDMTTKAMKLREKRIGATQKVETGIKSRLADLGMPNLRFEVRITDAAAGPDGMDKVAFLFSANKGGDMMPVESVASGGETARLMLALKAMISGAKELPTIIFDEIDTGVSGATAGKMGEMMSEMGRERQVVCITHLPQIAAMGRSHYKVSKKETETSTVSRLRRLNDEERIGEIAQMLSGSGITEAAINNAKALLNN